MVDRFLKTQIITYMGNKRKLLGQISEIVDMIKNELGENITSADAFSGSGIVSRLLKTKSTKLYVNDIAGYSETLNKCYLDTPPPLKIEEIKQYIDTVNNIAHNFDKDIGETKWISRFWAPSGEISKKDRVYFTEENGILIDRYRHLINKVPNDYRHYLLAQLIVKSSIHNNTNGQFSRFL